MIVSRLFGYLGYSFWICTVTYTHLVFAYTNKIHLLQNNCDINDLKINRKQGDAHSPKLEEQGDIFKEQRDMLTK